MAQHTPQGGNSRGPQRADQRAPQRPEHEEDLSFLYEEDLGGVFATLNHAKIPDGMGYKGVRVSTLGKEDPSSLAGSQRRRWVPVPKSRHPELVGAAEAAKDPDGAIIFDGLMLCERPERINEIARGIDTQRANDRVRNQVESLQLTGKNQAPRKVLNAGKKYNIQAADPDRNAGSAQPQQA